MTGTAGIRVLVCLKRVPDVAGEITLTADEQGVDARHVGFTVSGHEFAAVELALRAVAATGGGEGSGVTLLSVGPAEAAEQLTHVLGVGAQGAVLVEADPATLGPADVAAEIAAVVEAHAAEGRGYDLVLLGNDAADSGDFQVGIRLAHRLRRPVVNGAGSLEVADGRVRTRHDGPHGEEAYDLPMPAVVTVLEGGVEPRYPSLKGRMAAKKLGIERRERAHEPRGSGRVRLQVPPAQPSNVEILGQGPEAAPAVVDLLERMGVLR